MFQKGDAAGTKALDGGGGGGAGSAGHERRKHNELRNSSSQHE